MISIRCKICNKELIGHPTKTISCGCSNMATIRGEKISAIDLSNVVMLSNPNMDQKNTYLTNQDLMWQEERRKRKVRKLDFEVR